jgi:phosphatidylinositol alpha 1,6-mannosyltransferase
MSKFRTAIFTGNYNHIRDGVSLTLNRWVAFLLEQDVEVLVFGPTIDKPALEHAGTLVAVPSIKLPGRPEYRFSSSFPDKARKKLETFKPDLVHIATPDYLGLKALKWAKKNQVPVVSSYHTHFASYLKYYKLSLLEPLLWKYLSWFYGNCEHVYVPSPSMAKTLREKNIKSNLKIWARGIEPDLFNPNKRDEAWRKEQGFDENDVVISFISRLVWEKNLELFADVLNKLKKSYPQAKAMIVGDGPAGSELKKMLPDAVFTGFLTGEELAKAYACSDIFFFPSDTETFGNVTLEAMASGLPCVVADATGSRSLVEHGENGYIVPVERSDKFYKFIEKLITEKETRTAMSAASLEKAKNYSWEAINRKLLNDYNEVLKSKN